MPMRSLPASLHPCPGLSRRMTGLGRNLTPSLRGQLGRTQEGHVDGVGILHRLGGLVRGVAHVGILALDARLVKANLALDSGLTLR